jgi:ribosomal protein S18 acetylase RimI-like enzyme
VPGAAVFGCPLRSRDSGHIAEAQKTAGHLPGGQQTMVPMPQIVIRLAVRDLEPGDLPSCAWSGKATHLAAITRALERTRLGEVEYLAACPPSGLPVGLGAIDYAKTPGAGTIWMLEVHPALQSCGIGTVLIHAAEQRIRARGLRRAELGVEDGNPRARALYERLGYAAYGSEPGSWDQEAPDGTVSRYETMLTLMRKELPEGITPIGLRPVTDADSEFCYQLHKSAMGGYIAATWGWDEQVQRGFHARAFAPGRWQVITAGGADAGMLHVEYRPGEIYLARIEVRPDYQGRGIGTRFVGGLIDEARQKGLTLSLEVLAANRRARTLYERLGMTEVARDGDDNTKITMQFTSAPAVPLSPILADAARLVISHPLLGRGCAPENRPPPRIRMGGRATPRPPGAPPCRRDSGQPPGVRVFRRASGPRAACPRATARIGGPPRRGISAGQRSDIPRMYLHRLTREHCDAEGVLQLPGRPRLPAGTHPRPARQSRAGSARNRHSSRTGRAESVLIPRGFTGR